MTILERSWPLLELSWGAPGCSCVALGSLLAAPRGCGLGTLSLTVVWGLGSCETNGFTEVWTAPGREVTRGSHGFATVLGVTGGDYRGGKQLGA